MSKYLERGGSLEFFADALLEVSRAEKKHGPANSLHEAYAILLEEVDELWDEIKKQNPDHKALTEELVQIAAMCWKAQQVVNRMAVPF